MNDAGTLTTELPSVLSNTLQTLSERRRNDASADITAAAVRAWLLVDSLALGDGARGEWLSVLVAERDLDRQRAAVSGRTLLRDQVEYRSRWEHVAFYAFIILPFLALLAGVTLSALRHGLNPLTVVLFVVFYAVPLHGVTVGYHRLFTHRSFKANRPLKIALAVAGSLAIQGGVIRWVADHRKHHQNTEGPDDPHSPWRFGSGARNLTKGLWWAHTGWLFRREQAVKGAYAPDLLADPDLVRVHALFPLWVSLSVLAPPAIALGITGSWGAAGSALLWASLVRIFVLHHVTFAINSICHVVGNRPFRTKDRSTNFWPLALVSGGECWHNLHHAEPTSARHGVDRGQIDSSARLIDWFERLGWARDVRWPTSGRLDRKRRPASSEGLV